MALTEGKSWSHYVQVPGNDGALGHVVVYFTEFFDAVENYSVIKATGGVVNHSTKSGTFGVNLSAITTGGVVLLESANPFVGTMTQVGVAAKLQGAFPYTSGKLYHNSGGDCSITVTLEVVSMTSEDKLWEVWNKSSTQNQILTKIVRPSSVAAASGTIGQKISLNIIKASTGYTHTLRYALGSAMGTIVTKTSGYSVDWTPPMELCEGITDSTSAGCVLYCDTYDGNTLIGTTETVVRLSVPASVGLAVSDGWVTVRAYNVGTAVEGSERFVQGVSRAEAVFHSDKIDTSNAYGAGFKYFSISSF